MTQPGQHPADDLGNTNIAALWNKNAAPWDAGFDADGDDHRKYVTDEPLLAPLGDLTGLDVLDLGCGNGYLARKLARSGARVTGIEISSEMISIAARYEELDPIGVTYFAASATSLLFICDRSFDVIVCNHVLTSIPGLDVALAESHRVLRDGGRMALAFSHPCFSCGPRRWQPSSSDPEEADFYAVDHYFRRGSYLFTGWEGFAPIPYVHRTLSDYFRAFTAAGFTVTGFDEPTVNQRGRAELPPSRVQQADRIPYSCIFHLTPAAA